MTAFKRVLNLISRRVMTCLIPVSLIFGGCSTPTRTSPSWNLKEVRNDRYLERIYRNPAFIQIRETFQKTDHPLDIRLQVANAANGAMSGLYADGLSYDLSGPETAEQLRTEMNNVLTQTLGRMPDQAPLRVMACLDLTQGLIRMDAGSIKTVLSYQLMRGGQLMEQGASESCQTPPSTQAIAYRRETPLEATFDGSRLIYTVKNPSRPLSEMERFELILSDLGNLAMETLLTDDRLALAIRQQPEGQPNAFSQESMNQLKRTVCSKLGLKSRSAAFSACIDQL
jgi:hypothetical protein